MTHGIEAFFSERARARRRVAMNTVLTGAVVLAALGIVNLPPVSRALRQTPVLRFGFEGPPRYVRLIEVEARPGLPDPLRDRSEEHTSELQSRLHLVCRLLLEKKKKATTTPPTHAETSASHTQ